MRIEERVAKNDDKFRRLTKNTFADTAWVIDAKTFTYTYISPVIEKLRGYKNEDLIGNSPEKLLTPESFNHAVTILNKAIVDFPENPEKTYTLEIEVTNIQGISVWLEVSAKLFVDEDNRLKIVGLSKSIDDRKQKENEKNELIDRLNKALKEKERLVQEIKQFESLLPICSACRRIRDSQNTWWPIEKYIETKAGSKISHTICPDCTKVYYKK